MNSRHKFLRSVLAALIGTVMLATLAAGCKPYDPVEGGEDEGYSPIQSVLALGFVDKDGAKVKGIALEYAQDMTGAQITADTYSLNIYNSKNNINFGNGNVGDITKWYINSEPDTADGAAQGAGSGKYVILEVYTDYLSNAESVFTTSMIVHVTQAKDITLPDGSVIEAGTTESNNAIITEKVNEITGNVTTTTKLDPNGFVLPELEGFKFYIDEDPNGYGKDGDGFHQDHCFNQQDGLYYDVSVAYALYLPDNYEQLGKNGNWAMVTLENPAASPGTHPLQSVLQTRSPSYYATTGQEVVKAAHPEADIDGMIVVVPVVTERVNDNGGTPAEYEAIVHLWDYIIDEYGVNENYIYGSGQSVGGMILIETQRNRDNFFAGLLLYEDQWAQNYYVDTLFVRNMASNEKTAATADMHYPRTDSVVTWDYHYGNDGEIVTVEEGHDPYNMYYLISDDNMCVLRSDFNGLCVDNWNEMSYLYQDLTGDSNNRLNEGEFALAENNITASTLEQENEQIKAFLFGDKDGGNLNLNAITFTGDGGNGYSIRMYDATYEWLLSQSRQSEMERAKLDINKPFVAAEEQIQNEDRKLHFTDTEGDALYFVTGRLGAGTQFYNTGWYNLLTVADEVPGWLPEGMGSWTEGAAVTGSTIVGAQVIESGKAVAIEYSEDMTNLVVHLKGDKILAYGSTTEYRSDIVYNVDPFTFIDANGNEITCTIKNVYVNSSAATASGLGQGECSGCYIIVEFETALTATPVSVVQRTTLHTDKYIASAFPWTYEVN